MGGTTHLVMVAMVMVMMGEGQLARGDMTYTDTNADSCHGDLKINEENLL